MAQELLTTFAAELGGVLLRPSETGGAYMIWLGEEKIFDRRDTGHFPEIKYLKQAVRDHVNPEKSLGHSDRP
jgi:selenoprotein W-related protein